MLGIDANYLRIRKAVSKPGSGNAARTIVKELKKQNLQVGKGGLPPPQLYSYSS